VFVIMLLSWPGFYNSNVRNELQNGVTQLPIHLAAMLKFYASGVNLLTDADS